MNGRNERCVYIWELTASKPEIGTLLEHPSWLLF